MNGFIPRRPRPPTYVRPFASLLRINLTTLHILHSLHQTHVRVSRPATRDFMFPGHTPDISLFLYPKIANTNIHISIYSYIYSQSYFQIRVSSTEHRNENKRTENLESLSHAHSRYHERRNKWRCTSGHTTSCVKTIHLYFIRSPPA